MELNEYQKKAMETCLPTCDNFSYMFLNLVGEVGEFASKVAKQIRKGNMGIGMNGALGNELCSKNNLGEEYDIEQSAELALEAGDILWQLSGLCSQFGLSLDFVAEKNLEKLAKRKVNGTIDGSGDGVTKEERK